jgi:hypothetical protein
MPVKAPLSYHRDLYAYWLSKRGSRTMPARGGVNPADFPLLLPYVILVERVGEHLRYRLMGSAIVQAVGYGVTGGIVGSFAAAAEIGAEVRGIFECVFTSGSPIFATGRYIHKRGAGINLSLLTLPLSEDGRVVNMSISTLLARFSAAPAPERGWLEGLHVKVSDVTGVKDAAELEVLCQDWEQSVEPRPEMAASPPQRGLRPG